MRTPTRWSMSASPTDRRPAAAGRNQSLDLLRGLAISLVVLAHCGSATTSVVPGLAAFAADYGQMGVQLFFIVSGYTMMLTFGDRDSLAAARSFYIRRVFRIVPLFWIAIPVYLLITKGEGFTMWAPDGVSARDVALTVLCLHWSSVTAFNSVVPGGWSIAVEMQFYLLFPLIIRLFRTRNGAVLCYALIAMVSVAAQFAADKYLVPQLAAALPKTQSYLAAAFFYGWLPRQSICFGFGILLYDFIERKNHPTLGALLLIGASLFSGWGGVVVLLAAASFGILASKLTIPFASLLGRHSYAVYLAHFAVISAIQALLPLDLIPMAILVTGLALALSYYLVEPLLERPFNRLGHALASRMRRPETAIAGAGSA
jgi:exopolysaccharide production protein ExoZ